MPTARELLEQADALMRRNRGRDTDSEIPELTDEVAVASPEVRLREPSPVTPRPPPPQYVRRAEDVPELHDAVEELSIQPLPDDDGEISRWLEGDLGEASITGPAPDSIVVVPTSTSRVPPAPTEAPRVPAAGDDAMPAASAPPSDAGEDEALPAASEAPTASVALAARVSGTLSGPPAEPPPASDPGFDAMIGATAEAAFEQELVPNAPEPVAATPEPAQADAEPIDSGAAIAAADVPSDHQWEGLAEEIRMQVLQRIDIFTDTGLHGELAARLQPIVDRASADLVTTINREVGQILRAYVAEAIEREIEKWRETNP